MNEEFLHHVWKFRLFDQLNLKTTDGDPIEILKTGESNSDAGPDFFNSKIKIGDTLWAGNSEIHINASDWHKHFHQNNKGYDNIILHIVNNADVPIYRSSGEAIPTLEIKNRIDHKMLEKYLNFHSCRDWIPCEKQLANVPSFITNSTIDKLLLERLENKAKLITNSLKLNNNNWEETFYQHLAKNFGFKTNSAPFELLAKSLPSKYIAKHKSSLLQIEALLFGQAGFLNEHFEDPYLNTLQNEYVYLKNKFQLLPIDVHLWKFLRLRPPNFPTIRLAQFANLIYHSNHLFSKILELENNTEFNSLINKGVSEYWKTHYVLDKKSLFKNKLLGNASINNILINTIVPFLFVYGQQKDQEKYKDRAITFLEQADGDKNGIIEKWKSLKMPVKNAYSTQGLLQLKNEYCKFKKCLNCNIGHYLLKNS